MRLHPFFSYYGAKWRAARLYPDPQFNSIIEPFAGSACYSLLYASHNVTLVDIDPIISGLWQWLINVPEADIENLPEDFEELAVLDICDQAKTLIGFWLVKGSAVPVNRPYAWMRTGQWENQFWGPQIKARIKRQLRYIRHWRVVTANYQTIRNREATWFIDPPYQRMGQHYRYNEINHRRLGKWCKGRKGQVIVCEQEGADWLPFQRFKPIKSLKSGFSNEVVFLAGAQGLLI